MKRTIVLTGCAGFIGANFVKKIAVKNQDFDFIVIDSLTYAGHYPTIEKDIEENSNLTFEEIDIRDAQKVEDLFSSKRISGVIHFAAESHVDNSIKNPNLFVETNVLGTLNLLNSSLKNGGEDFRFCHVSTDEVYGELEEGDPAFTEEHPLEPNSPYSASKASSDLLVRSFTKTFGLNTVTTRCSNNYGPFQFPEKLIPLMIDKALKNEKLPIYGDGKNIRDWIFVEDHVEGIWSAFLKGRKGEVYNFGGDAEVRNIEVVECILDILDKPKSLMSFVEDRKGHDWRYAIDFSKAKNELGFKPSINFKEGIKVTVDWYLKNQTWLQSVRNKK